MQKQKQREGKIDTETVTSRLYAHWVNLQPLIHIICDVHVCICCLSVVLSFVSFLVFGHRSRRSIVTTLGAVGIDSRVRRNGLDATKSIVGDPGKLE
jgi:hypothetical protein